MKVPVLIIWQYGNQIGRAIDWFGYDGFNPLSDEDMSGLFYFYEEGNGSCDCNRASMIEIDDDMACGDSIEFHEIKPFFGAGHRGLQFELTPEMVADYDAMGLLD